MNSSWWMGSMNKYGSQKEDFVEYTKSYSMSDAEYLDHIQEETLAERQQKRIEELEARLRKFDLLTGRVKND